MVHIIWSMTKYCQVCTIRIGQFQGCKNFSGSQFESDIAISLKSFKMVYCYLFVCEVQKIPVNILVIRTKVSSLVLRSHVITAFEFDLKA